MEFAGTIISYYYYYVLSTCSLDTYVAFHSLPHLTCAIESSVVCVHRYDFN